MSTLASQIIPQHAPEAAPRPHTERVVVNMPARPAPEVSIVMPCLNEAETLAVCIKKAQKYLRENGVDGEVLIADNGSTDGSQEIAMNLGAPSDQTPLPAGQVLQHQQPQGSSVMPRQKRKPISHDWKNCSRFVNADRRPEATSPGSAPAAAGVRAPERRSE